jgi:hypothetical protein
MQSALALDSKVVPVENTFLCANEPYSYRTPTLCELAIESTPAFAMIRD